MSRPDPEGGLPCPRCGLRADARVVDSRPSGDNIRRRRICTKCSHRFTTFEVVGEPGTISDALTWWHGLDALSDHERIAVLNLIHAMLHNSTKQESLALPPGSPEFIR